MKTRIYETPAVKGLIRADDTHDGGPTTGFRPVVLYTSITPELGQ